LIAQTKAPNADQELYVTLLLHPMPITDQAQTDPQELFEKTKRHLVECLLCGCPGDTVPMMLKNPTLEREEQNYRELPHSAEN
uniref:Selenoprotein M n=1 Tax=Anisakis simplex TaxID=6269 RepID=A0A0M3KKG4_ANISI